MKLQAIVKSLRPHWPFLAILSVGIVLRVLALMAYHPALLFYGDSEYYMQNAIDLLPTSFHPLGYAFYLRALTVTGRLVTVPITQHLFGLVAGVLVYVILLRIGTKKWLATIGSAPILLDAYGIDLESTVLTEAIVGALLIAVFVILFWNRKTPSKVALVCIGVLLAFTTVTRSSVAVMIVPIVAYIFITARKQTHSALHALLPVGVLLVAFAAPIIGYAAYHHAHDKNFTIDTKTPFFLYSRLAPLADCKALSPADQLFCAPIPNIPGEKHDINWYLWGGDSPLRTNFINAHLNVFDLPEVQLQQFDIAVLKQKPLQYMASTLSEMVSYFSVNDVKNLGDSSPTNLQFPTKPVWSTFVRLADDSFVPQIAANKDPARLPSESAAKKLHAYQRVAYVPGPVLAVATLLVVAAVCIKRNRQTLIAATLVSSALLYLLLTCALAGEYYRYIVPVETLFVAGGVIGLDVILRHKRQRK